MMKNIINRTTLLMIPVLTLLLLLNTVTGSNWQTTTVQLLQGSGYKLSDKDQTVITFQHVSGWRLGSNFFFFDVAQPHEEGTSVYGEWYSWLNLNPLFNSSISRVIPGAVSLGMALNLGESFRAYQAGLNFAFTAPGFNLLSLDVMTYDDQSDTEMTHIITPAWDLPFSMAGLQFQFSGYVDFIGSEGDHSSQIITQPQLLLDLGNIWQHPGVLQIGLEYHYWQNKYGLKDIDETVPQWIISWNL